MTATITLTTAGVDTGNFSLYSDVDGYITAFESGITRAALLAGFTSTSVPAGTTIIRVKSITTCTNYIDLAVEVTTTTIAPTTTTTTCTPNGTFLYTTCSGTDLHNVYANGTCGTYSTVAEVNSASCGYIAPTVSTYAVTNIGTTTATGNGAATYGSDSPFGFRGIAYSTSPNPTIGGDYDLDGSGSGAITTSMTGLISNTLYYVRAFAYDGVTHYGNQVTFTTGGSPTTTTTLSPTTTTLAPTTTTTTAADPNIYYSYNMTAYYCGTCTLASSGSFSNKTALTVGKYYYLPLTGTTCQITSFISMNSTYNADIAASEASTCAGVTCPGTTTTTAAPTTTTVPPTTTTTTAALAGACGMTEDHQDTSNCPSNIVVYFNVCTPAGFILGTDGIKTYLNGVAQGVTYNSTLVTISIPPNTSTNVNCSILWNPENIESALLPSNVAVSTVPCTTTTTTAAPTTTTTTADTTAPAQVTGVTASTADASSVINWNATTDNVGVTQYKVIVSDSEAIPNVFTNYTTNLTFTQTGLVNGRAYTVTLQARDAAGNWSSPSVSVAFTPVAATTTTTTVAGDTTPPSQVTGLILSNPLNYTIGASWSTATDNVGVVAYEVQTNEDSLGWSPGTLEPSTSTQIGGFTGGSNVEVRVRAQDAAGNFGAWSNISSIIVTGAA